MKDKQIFKVGDKAWFKNDIEGRGIVALVKSRYSTWSMETTYEYAVRSESEPEGYPFHRMAVWNEEVKAMVVWVDEDHIWSC